MDARGRRTSSGYTNTVVAKADAVQYECGEDPCRTAWATERSVLLKDIQEESRWPEWRKAVQGLPVRSVVSAPLITGNRACGVLMERLEISHEAALQWLIRHARDENSAMQDISERVLAGTPAPGR
ncbi:MAG: transcriptional regulator containing AAA-type ATPase, and binding domain [Pseudarthrobacter sp.]|nr:transcriptional regulator containing AAA-type ATPase, and binding domain [Pseudarthrobacter sp.]